MWLANCRPPRKCHCRQPQYVLLPYWGRLRLFHLWQGCSKKAERLGCMGSFAKAGVKTVAFMNGLWLAYCRPPRKGHHRPPHKGHLRPHHKVSVLMHRIVRFVNRVRPSNKLACSSMGYFSYCTNCHVCALFINRYRLASNGHVLECDVVPSRFLCQVESLA